MTSAPQEIGGYVLERVLASGGMGLIHVAREPETGRQVALKVLLNLRGGSGAKRFAQEAQTVARLRHRHIVPVHAAGDHEGMPWFVMDLVAGESLDARIARAGPLEPRLAARIAAQVADALAYAHGEGVVHRDIKPANVLLDEQEQALLTDFGLSKDLASSREELTRTGQMLGTPSFMPREQAVGHVAEIGPRSDVYSLGATLYMALTGRPPYDAENLLALVAAIAAGRTPPLQAKRPDVPADLALVCLKCLQVEPDDRYPSAAALAADLQRFLAGEPVEAKPVGAAARAERWARRHLKLLAVAAVGSVVLAALAIGERSVGDRRRAAEAWSREVRAASEDGRAADQRARAWLWQLSGGEASAPPSTGEVEAALGRLEAIGEAPPGVDAERVAELEGARAALVTARAALRFAVDLPSGRATRDGLEDVPEGPERALLEALLCLRQADLKAVERVERLAASVPGDPGDRLRLRAGELALSRGEVKLAERLLAATRERQETARARARLRAKLAVNAAVAAARRPDVPAVLEHLRSAREADPALVDGGVRSVGELALKSWKEGRRLTRVLVLLDALGRTFGTTGLPKEAADAYLAGAQAALKREDWRGVERYLRQGRLIDRSRMQASKTVVHEVLSASCRLLRQKRDREGFEVLLLSLRSGAGMGAFEALTMNVGMMRVRSLIMSGIHDQVVAQSPTDWAARVVRMSINLNFRRFFPMGMRGILRNRCRADSDWLLKHTSKLPPEIKKSVEHGELLLRLQERRYADVLERTEELIKAGFPDPHVILQLAFQASARVKRLPPGRAVKLARRWVAAVELRLEQQRTKTVPPHAGGAGLFGNASLKPEGCYSGLVAALLAARQYDEAWAAVQTMRKQGADQRITLCVQSLVRAHRGEREQAWKDLEQGLSGLELLPPALQQLRDRVRARLDETAPKKPAPKKPAPKKPDPKKPEPPASR